MPGPQLGERRTFGTQTGEWDGKGWKPVASAPAGSGGMLQTLGDTLTGVLKGAGATAFDLGNLVHSTKSGSGMALGDMTDALSKLAYKGYLGATGKKDDFFSADAAFQQPPPGLEAANTAQSVGKGAEQVGEFFIPAGPTKAKLIERLVQLIPDAASPATAARLNKLLAVVGRVGGEAASAGGVSSLHGAENPTDAALTAGGMTAGGHLLGPAMGVLNTSAAKKVAPILAASAAMRMLPKASLGGTMGMYGLMKDAATKTMQNPSILTRRSLQSAGRYGRAMGAGAGRTGAGIVDRVEAPPPPRRRRVE